MLRSFRSRQSEPAITKPTKPPVTQPKRSSTRLTTANKVSPPKNTTKPQPVPPAEGPPARLKPSSSFFRNAKFEDSYSIGQVIGRGAFSVVHEGINKKRGHKVAIKIIQRFSNGKNEEAVRNEIDILRLVNDHPNVVHLEEIFQDPQKTYLVMELVTGGELFDRILEKEFFSEADSRDIMLVIFRTIQHMHSHGVVHRDLKPENILYASKDENSPIKIADFGLAKLTKKTQNNTPQGMDTMCGTPTYVAPEVIEGTHLYSSQCDVWSVGVILYVLLCGFPPFEADDPVSLFHLICKGEYSFPSPYWDSVTSEAKDLVSKLLVKDPELRLTPLQALNHPWMLMQDAGSRMDLSQLKEYIRQSNRRKFKMITNAVLVAKRLEQLGRSGDLSSPASSSPASSSLTSKLDDVHD